MFVAITREIVTAVTKLLTTGSSEGELTLEAASSPVREILERGDELLRGGLQERALEMYSRAAEDYAERGYAVQAVAVYKRMLRIDDKQAHVRAKIDELHSSLGVSAEVDTPNASVIVEADDIVESQDLDVEHQLEDADLLESHDL